MRDIPDTHEKLAHELCDCLWSIIVLAHHSHVDLESAFAANMDALSEQIAQHLRDEGGG